MSSSPNPLASYFRLPGIYVVLPSGGRFLPEGSVEFVGEGKVPVLPMRTADELMMKNPEALMSGYAIEQMLESCVPAIKTPKLISSADLDVLLLAIRAATYGDLMEVGTTCPECKHESEFDVNLPILLNDVSPIPDDTSVRLSDEIVVDLRPYNFEDTTKLSLTVFEETRKVQALDVNEATEEERTHQIKESTARLNDLTTSSATSCVMCVHSPNGKVTDREYIAEFMDNIARPWSKLIEEKLVELNSAGVNKKVPVTCQRCEHEYESAIEFDPATFFD